MKKPTKTKSLFKGKETYKEELNEAKAIKSGKLTPKQYAKGEKSEDMTKMKKGGKTKCYADGGRARMSDDGSYSMGKPPSISEAMSDNGDRLGGRNTSMTLPGQSRPANRAATGGSGYKPYSGSSAPAKSTPASKVSTGMTLEEAKPSKPSKPSTPAPKAASPKPVTKKAAPAPVKRKPSGSISAADLEAFRQENMADRAKAGLGGSANEDDALPVGAEAYKKGGKTGCMKKGGSVRGDGAACSGRTRGRII